MENIVTNAVELAKRLCRLKLSEGDKAVDCTMGNGNDTAFLCSLVGDTGKVYAFDIQEQALKNTRQKLRESGFLDRAELILAGHETLAHYVKDQVRLIIFNLGYLPKGDHAQTTRAETTLEALRKSLELLEAGGAAILIIYPGHAEGKREKDALAEFTSALDQKAFSVLHCRFTNQVNNPPELICLEKRTVRP